MILRDLACPSETHQEDFQKGGILVMVSNAKLTERISQTFQANSIVAQQKLHTECSLPRKARTVCVTPVGFTWNSQGPQAEVKGFCFKNIYKWIKTDASIMLYIILYCIEPTPLTVQTDFFFKENQKSVTGKWRKPACTNIYLALSISTQVPCRSHCEMLFSTIHENFQGVVSA